MKKNKSWILLMLLLVVLFGIGVYYYFASTKNNNESSYEANRTSTNVNNEENSSQKENTFAENQTLEEQKNQEENKSNDNKVTEEKPKEQQYTEKQLSSFSTKIYSKDSARQNNIKITCNTLNNTTVKNGSTFSFCDTVGKATSAKGYQEADVYDHNGNKTKGLGGGNCQVSSTLYNAVLAVSSLNVTERHSHSNDVPYVQDGKDAAVAYGSYDLKFVNNTGNDIKIKASTNGSSVTISINSIKPI